MPFVSPVTIIGEASPTRLVVAPPPLGVHAAVKSRIAVPLFAPGVNATAIDWFPRVTLVIVGGLGATAKAGPAAIARAPAITTSATTHRVVRNAPRSRTRPLPHHGETPEASQ